LEARAAIRQQSSPNFDALRVSRQNCAIGHSRVPKPYSSSNFLSDGIEFDRAPAEVAEEVAGLTSVRKRT
jgi:hypothetical protein